MAVAQTSNWMGKCRCNYLVCNNLWETCLWSVFPPVFFWAPDWDLTLAICPPRRANSHWRSRSDYCNQQSKQNPGFLFMQAVHKPPLFLRAMLCAERNSTHASRKAGVFIASTWQLLHYITAWETFFLLCIGKDSIHYFLLYYHTNVLHVSVNNEKLHDPASSSRFRNRIRSISSNSRKERPNSEMGPRLPGETLSLSITKVQSRQHCIWGRAGN